MALIQITLDTEGYERVSILQLQNMNPFDLPFLSSVEPRSEPEPNLVNRFRGFGSGSMFSSTKVLRFRFRFWAKVPEPDLNRTSATLALTVVYICYGMMIRTPMEDRALREEFKEKWVAWSDEVPNKLVPYIY